MNRHLPTIVSTDGKSKPPPSRTKRGKGGAPGEEEEKILDRPVEIQGGWPVLSLVEMDFEFLLLGMVCAVVSARLIASFQRDLDGREIKIPTLPQETREGRGTQRLIHSESWGAPPFASPINFWGAPPLSRFVRQGGGFDFLYQRAKLPCAPACERSSVTQSRRYPRLR